MSRRIRRLSTIPAALSAAALIGAAVSVPADAAPEPGAGEGYYEVVVGSQRAAVDLRSTGADITRIRGGKAEVVTDAAGADTLRQKGYTVTFRAGLYAKTPPKKSASGTFYGGYHTTAAHEAHNAKVAQDFPNLAKVHDIGDSYLKTVGQGGHDIQAVCITEDAPNGCSLSTSGKPKMLLMGQIHARELSTGELAYRWIDELTTSTDPEIVELRKTRELWVIPIANPDGVDRVASRPDRPISQRKNMNHTAGGDAQCGTGTLGQGGVDLNRNSDFAWDGTIAGPCGLTYPGKSAGSEPETQAVQGLMKAIYPDKRDDAYSSPVQQGATGTFLTLHSYGNYIIHPYSFTNSTKAPDTAALKALGSTMQASNGYRMGTAGETVGYTAPGGTDDWAYGRLGVASYTFEVGDQFGTCGGFFPAYSCMGGFWDENRGAFIAAAKAAADPYGQQS